jgi:ABC-2 type transport system ATP-binding protein
MSTPRLSDPVAVSIRSVTKQFNARVRALDAVTFDIPVGKVTAVVGPNGAGKTTLFSLIANFLRPTSGEIQVLGIDVRKAGDLRGRFTILPQDALFQANVPVREQLVFMARLNGMSEVDATRDANRVLDMVGLMDSAKKSARSLSHGMTKRLGIAQALLGKPEVIILDEPTAGLDPANASGVRRLISDIKVSGQGTIIVSSHDLDEMQELAQVVAILDKGKLVELKSMTELTRHEGVVRMHFGRKLTDEEEAFIKGLPGVVVVSPDTQHEYTIGLHAQPGISTSTTIGPIVAALAGRGLIPRSVKEGASLEERFLAVTGGKAAT